MWRTEEGGVRDLVEAASKTDPATRLGVAGDRVRAHAPLV